MLGIQIYTVRSLLETPEGCEKTLPLLRDMGYECIQLSGSFEMMKNCVAAAKNANIAVNAILTGTAICNEHGDELIELALSAGAYDIGISGMPQTVAEADALIKEANAFAKRVRYAGLSFSYHNHSHEFIRTEYGKTFMDILLEGFEPELIDLMPDTYWLQHGGVDVRDFIEKHAKRIKILHLKDMKRTADGVTFAEVGEGNINIKGILALAEKIGVKDLIVEQDICDDPLVSAEKSITNLKKLLGR